MNDMPQQILSATSDETSPGDAPKTVRSAKDWLQALNKYRTPSLKRSLLEMVLTAAPFVALWIFAWWALSISFFLTLAIAVPAALFLVRMFIIQHDCGHGAYFRRKATNDWVGRVLGVITLTPYDVWRRAHAVHHATSGNLDKRGLGDIDTLTIEEYHTLPFAKRMAYRLYRNPIVLFVIGPAYQFLLANRLPMGLMTAGWRYWVSAMATNAAIIAASGLLIYAIGLGPFLMVQLPITILAASVGVWMFYVQHQFEETCWLDDPVWDKHDAALFGSSHYDLPKPLAWATGNIGIHHVHHLCDRIPFYRLPQVLRDFPELTGVNSGVHRLTFTESLSCIKLRLWDEGQKQLVSFSKAREIYASRNN